MAVYTVQISSAGSPDVVSLTDGSTYATLEVSAGRGPKGDGWTGVTYSTETGRFTFTSNDGIGYVSDDITVGLDAAVTEAEAAQAAAEAAQAATENIFDQFGDQYLGPKASDPTVDNDGDPLTEGDIYFNTTDDVLKFYSGTAWVAPESIATTAANEAEASATAAATSETNAASSASAASTSETNAASSASAASTSETNAATSETNAASSASAASTSETNAAASETAAAASETAAATSETNAATSESNAASSASAASTSASNAATSETNAASSASAASTSATNAATSASNASTSETNAASSAAAASTSADEAAASAASINPDNIDINGGTIDGTVIGGSTPAAGSFTNISATGTVDGRDVAADGSKLDGIEAGADVTDTANVTAAGALMDSELTDISAVKALDQGVATTDDPTFANTQLAEIAATISDTAVDVFVYDTSKDSDGGAWRKRTQGKSWYNETLNTATRGSRREFPAVAVIVAESSQVTIYDGDDPDLPMWMVFNAGPYSYIYSGLSSASAINGQLVTGSNDGLGAASWVDFIGDQSVGSVIYSSTEAFKVALPVSGRNNTTASLRVTGPSMQLVNRIVNDVAMTVLPNAPIDAATGLPVPTIAVATRNTSYYSGSVIKDDGTVVDINSYAGNTSHDYEHVTFSDDGTIWWARDFVFNDGYAYVANTTVDGVLLAEYGSTFNGRSTSSVQLITTGSTANIPKINDISMRGSAVGQTVGLNIFDYSDTDQDRSSVSHITSDYNTGWMNGDIKLATLSDTDDTDVTGSELVTNGDFGTGDLTGWDDNSTGTGSVVYDGGTDSAKLTRVDGNNNGILAQGMSLVSGTRYVLSFDIDSGTTASNLQIRGYISSTNTTGTIFENSLPVSGGSSYSVTFTCPSGEDGVEFRVVSPDGTFALIDNISVRLAEEDRSVNRNGLQVFGTVTKNPVATGADLVAYSGFSASNYLEQPYNSDLDFGTGDFCIMGWVKQPPSGTTEPWIQRATDATSGRINFYSPTSSVLRLLTYGSSQIILDTTTTVDTGQWTFVVARRSSGTSFLYINGEFQVSGANTQDLSNTSATTVFGHEPIGGTASTTASLALWRISATAPSPEQIKKIYEDEKVLFQENAQATLYGSSDAVTALAYDDSTELLHVGTSAGRSDFQGLRRVNNTTNAVGAAISASNGMIVEE